MIKAVGKKLFLEENVEDGVFIRVVPGAEDEQPADWQLVESVDDPVFEVLCLGVTITTQLVEVVWSGGSGVQTLDLIAAVTEVGDAFDVAVHMVVRGDLVATLDTLPLEREFLTVSVAGRQAGA